MIVRVALSLARTPDPAHRWRQTAVPLAAAVSIFLLLAAGSLISLLDREAERGSDRIGTLAGSSPSPSDLLMVPRTDNWADSVYISISIEPAGAAAPVLPPGLGRLPSPGRAALSPALHELTLREPMLASRYPHHLVLDPAGIRSGGELLAYTRPPAGRTIRGYTSLQRVQRFGPPHGAQGFDPSYGSPVDFFAIAAGASAFLLIPSLLVLIAGVATASPARDRRFAILRALGASRGTIARLGMVETIALALPGAVGAALVFRGFVGGLTSVPLVGHAVLPGDLQAPFAFCLGLIVAHALLAGAIAVAIGRPSAATSVRPRPIAGRSRARWWRAIPLGLALGLAVGGAAAGGESGGTAMIIGLVSAVAALPVAGPGLMALLGGVLARSPSVSGLLAGRRLQWDPVRIGRPFGLCGAMVVLAIATVCYVALARSVEPTRLPAGPDAAVSVSWADPHRGDLDLLADELGSGTVVGLVRSRLAIDCSELAEQVGSLQCDSGGEQATKSGLGLLRRLLPVESVSGFDPGASTRTADTAAVFDHGSLQALDRRLRTAADRVLAAPSLSSAFDLDSQPSELVGWLTGAILLAGLALAFGALLLVVDAVCGRVPRAGYSRRLESRRDAWFGSRRRFLCFRFGRWPGRGRWSAFVLRPCLSAAPGLIPRSRRSAASSLQLAGPGSWAPVRSPI